MESQSNNSGNEKAAGCRLRIKKMTLLANTKEEFIRSFTVGIPVEKITKEFRKELIKMIKANKGKKLLNLKILDKKNKLSVDFFSKKYAVDVNNDLLDYLIREGLNYSVEVVNTM